MSDEKVEPAKEAKKRIGKRKQSSYIVLKTVDVAEVGTAPPEYKTVAEGGSVKACIKAIEDGKIVGKLLIVCVRRRLLSEVQETLKLT